MDDPSLYSSLYESLNRLGPRMLVGVHPELEEWLQDSARDTDDFWPSMLGVAVDKWEEGNPEDAVRDALEQWVHAVRQHFGSVLGPDSLIPFDRYGVSPSKRWEWEASVENIRLKLDEEHVTLFIDSVLLKCRNSDAAAKLVVQAIVQPYRDTHEGQLVHAVAIPWRAIVASLKNDWSLAYKISPRKWEELIAAAFDQADYDEVTLTPRSGDHGRDVIAVWPARV